MSLITTYIASLCFYGTSKYFPEDLAFLGKFLQKNKALSYVLGILLSVLSVWSLTQYFTFTTALIFWAVLLMTILSSIIVSLKISKHWMGFWLILSFGVLIIEFII